MNTFDKAFKEVLQFEGGYSDHKADRGGKTKYGITEQVARVNGYIGDMRDLPLEKAKEIYYKNYFVNHNYHLLPEAIAVEMFDQAVNMGCVTANKHLQRVLNLLLDSDSVAVDGVLGPITARYAEAVYKVYPTDMVRWLNILQGARYLEIIESNPSQKVFARGWGKRVNITGR